MWAYLRALLYTMFCDGLRDALGQIFGRARPPARRDLGVACPDGGRRLHFFEPAIAGGGAQCAGSCTTRCGATAAAARDGRLARTLRAAGVEACAAWRAARRPPLPSAAVIGARDGRARRRAARRRARRRAGDSAAGRSCCCGVVRRPAALAPLTCHARARGSAAHVAGAFTLCAIVSPTRNCAHVARRSGASGASSTGACARGCSPRSKARATRRSRARRRLRALDDGARRARAFARRASAPEPVPLRAGARVRRARRVCPAHGFDRGPTRTTPIALAVGAVGDEAEALILPSRRLRRRRRPGARAPPCVPVRMVAARDDIVVDPASLPTPAAAARLELELTERGAHCGDPRGVGASSSRSCEAAAATTTCARSCASSRTRTEAAPRVNRARRDPDSKREKNSRASAGDRGRAPRAPSSTGRTCR